MLVFRNIIIYLFKTDLVLRGIFYFSSITFFKVIVSFICVK
nr:MAG TPA: hypothetical protein [Caudoviricetes sp.]